MALRPRMGALSGQDVSPAPAPEPRDHPATPPAAMDAAHATRLGDEAAHAAERRRADQAEHLAATVSRVGAAPDIASALEELLRGAMAVLGGQHGVVRLFGPAPGERPLELIIDSTGRLNMRTRPRPLEPGSFAAALQAGEPAALVEDFWALDPVAYPAYATMRREGLRSAVNVPIEAGGRRIGSLHVDHAQPGFFGPADLAFAEALAAHAAASIERARLETAREEAVAAREAAARQLAEQAKELARRAAEAAALRELDRLKDELLATIAHELRTPLTVTHGYAQRLARRARTLSPAAIEATAGRIVAGTTQLTRLVEDLVEFARAERGELVVQSADFDLAPLLRDVLAEFRGRPGGERLLGEVPLHLPVHADRARVTQVIANLVENALKYAPEGPIVLRAETHAAAYPAPGLAPEARPAMAAQPSPIVRVEVADSGPGIPKREQSRVWEKFYRGQRVVTHHLAGGTGIGLAVVKALVEAQGGQVGLDSTPGHGATFWFDLPAAGGQVARADAAPG